MILRLILNNKANATETHSQQGAGGVAGVA